MQLAEQRASDQEQFEKAQAIHQEELEKCTSQLSKSLKKREMEYSQLESMHMAVKGELEQRVQELEIKVTKSKEKVKQAEHRRAMDAEGFTNDVSLLRKQLTAVDRKLHQMRLQNRLEDDERLHGLLQKLERKGGAGCDQVCLRIGVVDVAPSMVHYQEFHACMWAGLATVHVRVGHGSSDRQCCTQSKIGLGHTWSEQA